MSPPPAEVQFGQDSFEDYEDDFSDADHSDEDQMAGRSGLSSSWPDPFDEGTEESGSGGEYQAGSSLETPTARSLNNPSCSQSDAPFVSLSQDVSLPRQQQVSNDLDRLSASNLERRALEMKEILVLMEHLEPLIHSTLDSVIESALVSREVSNAGMAGEEFVSSAPLFGTASNILHERPDACDDEEHIQQMKAGFSSAQTQQPFPLAAEDFEPLVDSTLNSIIDSALLSRQDSESGLADTAQVSSPIPPDESPTMASSCQQIEEMVPEIRILQVGLHGAESWHSQPSAFDSNLVRTTGSPPRQNSLDEQEAVLAAAVSTDTTSRSQEDACLDATLDFTAELDEHSFLEESRMPQEKQDLLLSCSSLNLTLTQELSGSEFRETILSQDISSGMAEAAPPGTNQVQSATSNIDGSSDVYASTVKLDWSLAPHQLEVSSACSSSKCEQSKPENTATDLATLLFEALDGPITVQATDPFNNVAEFATREVEQMFQDILTHASSKGTDASCSATLAPGHEQTDAQDATIIIPAPLPVPLIAEDSTQSISSQFAQQEDPDIDRTSCLDAQSLPDFEQSSKGRLPEHELLEAYQLEAEPLATKRVCPPSSEEPGATEEVSGTNSSSKLHDQDVKYQQVDNPLPASSPKPSLVELKETFAEACRGGAAVGVRDLLADLQDELLGTSIGLSLSGQEHEDEEDGGFFISNGGGGLNLQLGDDFDVEDLTEATRRVYLTALPAQAACTLLHSSGPDEVSLKANEAPVDPESLRSGYGHAIQNPPEVARTTTVETLRSSEVEVLLRARLVAKEAIMNSVLKAVFQLQALSMEIQLASLRASEPPKETELSQVRPDEDAKVEEDQRQNHTEAECFTDVASDEQPYNRDDPLTFNEEQPETGSEIPMEQVIEAGNPCVEETSMPVEFEGPQPPSIEEVVKANVQPERRGSTSTKSKRLSTGQKSQLPASVKATRGNCPAERNLVPRRPEAPRSTRPSPRSSIQAAASRSATSSNQNIKREQRLQGRLQTNKSSKDPKAILETEPVSSLPEEPPAMPDGQCEAVKDLEELQADADGAFEYEVSGAEFQYHDEFFLAQASDVPNEHLDFTFSESVQGAHRVTTADDVLLYQEQQMFLYQQQQHMMYQQQQQQMLWQQQLYQSQMSDAPYDQPNCQLQFWQMNQLQQWQMSQMQMQQFSQQMLQGHQPAEMPEFVPGSSPSVLGSKPPKPTLKGSRTEGHLQHSRTGSLTCIDQTEQNEEISELVKGTTHVERPEQQDEKVGSKSSPRAGYKESQLPQNKKGTNKKEKTKGKDAEPWKKLLFLPLDSTQAQRSVCSLSSYSSVATLHRILAGGRSSGDSQLRGRSEDSLLDWSTVTPCVPTSTDGTKAQEDYESATRFQSPNFPWPDAVDSEEFQDQQLEHDGFARSVGGSALHAARNLRGDLEGNLHQVQVSRQLSLPARKLSESSKVKGPSPRHFSLETRNRRRPHP